MLSLPKIESKTPDNQGEVGSRAARNFFLGKALSRKLAGLSTARDIT